MIKNKLIYHFSKIAPYGKQLTIKLNNGIKCNIRSKTMDKAVLKEVWITNLYGKHSFDIKEKDVVVDIGAHIGMFAIYAAHKAKNGKVISFEPFIKNYELLESNAKINNLKNLKTQNVAVGKKNGQQRLYLSPDNNTGGHSLYLKTENNDSFVDIPTISYNSMIENYKLDKIDYLKLDCEGAEYDILFNASKQAISKIEKIVMECHPHKDNTKEKMIEFLKDSGFELIIDNSAQTTELMIYAKRI